LTAGRVACVLLLAGALVVAPRLTGCDRAELITTEVERGPLEVAIEARGELAAQNSKSITRPRRRRLRGQIVRMVDEGTVVEKGDFLVQFDASEAERELLEEKNAHENALAELATTQASSDSRMAELVSQVRTQEYSLEQARIRFEQMEYEAAVRRREQELELRKAELALEEARDRIESQRVVDEANLRKARIAVEQAAAEVAAAQEAVDSQTLTAPISGLVVYKEIWKGDAQGKVGIGDEPWPGQELLEIPDLGVMMVHTKVGEVDVHRIEIGQDVRIEIDALEGLTLRGEVKRVAALARGDEETQGETKSFEVEVLIDGHDPRLRPGMSALCSIIVQQFDDVLSVPLDAVFEEGGRPVVYVVDGGVEAREVLLGARNRDFVIVEEHLREGETISLRNPRTPLESLEAEDDEPARGSPGPASLGG